MKLYFTVAISLLLTACNTLPQLYQAAEDMADDTAIKVEIQREALNKDPDILINVQVNNKDPK